MEHFLLVSVFYSFFGDNVLQSESLGFKGWGICTNAVKNGHYVLNPKGSI